jgi:hypothetical protein
MPDFNPAVNMDVANREGKCEMIGVRQWIRQGLAS